MTESSERKNRACAFVAKQIGNFGAKQGQSEDRERGITPLLA